MDAAKAKHNKSAVPDGGWGWMIVAAVAVIQMTNQSILSVFGLLFVDQLKLMQAATFTAALITNLNSLALNFSGLFVGPAIKSFKPRNVAATGCLMVSFGLFICSFATSIWQFIVGYSFFVGMGLGLISPSTFMAINSYFSSKRGRAVGFSLAGSGIGQIFIPHFVRFFLDLYGFRIAILSMSILSLTGLIGAAFLKPLQHKPIVKHNNHQHFQPLLETAHDKDKQKQQQKQEDVSIDITIIPTNETATQTAQTAVYQQTTLPKKQTSKETLCDKLSHRFVQAMDLVLLKDPVFISIIVGMAMVYTSTINFTMVFPAFLKDSVGISREQTASCMSIVASADIVCRLLLPCITDKLKIPYRLIFLFGTIGLCISRAALAEAVEMPTIIVMSIFTGMTKSATVLNNNLTISSYCRPEKLAGGLGLSMISKGLIVISIGQLLGWIRDYTDSYVICLHAQNLCLLFVVIVWTPEICYRQWQQRKRARSAAVLASNNTTEEELDHLKPAV